MDRTAITLWIDDSQARSLAAVRLKRWCTVPRFCRHLLFAFSTVLLYALAIVFSGQGISALQTTGYLPLHPVRLPNLPALGIYATVETYVVQATLVLLALGAAVLLRVQRTPPGPPVTPGGGMAGSREGAKL